MIKYLIVGLALLLGVGFWVIYWQEIKIWYKKWRFYQAAIHCGLPLVHRQILWQMVEVYRPKNVNTLLMNSRLLNKMLLRAIGDLDLDLSINLKDRELLQYQYYEVKRFFDRVVVVPSLRSTRELKENTRILFNKPQNVRITFNGWVVSVIPLGFWLELDRPSGEQWRTLKEQGEFEFLYIDEHNIEHHFVSKLKQRNENQAEIKLLFSHAKTVEVIGDRRPPLRRFNQDAVIARADLGIDKSGQRQFLPQKEQPCYILELSLASAVIKSLSGYDVNQFVYLQFMGSTQPVVCYGRVERVVPVAQHVQVHIQFLQTSRASLNQISSLVYDL